MSQPDLFAADISDMRTDWKPSAPPVLDGLPDIELDTETDGLRVVDGTNKVIGISVRSKAAGINQYLPFGHRGGGNLDEAIVKRWALEQLKHKSLRGLHARFDNHGMYHWGVDLEAQGCIWTDVQHQAALLDDSRRRFSMDVLAKEFLGREKVGKELDGQRMADYHSSMVAQRAMMDVEITGQLYDIFAPRITEQGLDEVQALENEIIFVVCEMERNGAPLDLPTLHRWVKESQKEYEQCLWSIFKETGLNFDPGKNTDWVDLFRRTGQKIPGWTATGAASFTDSLLKDNEHPVIKLARTATRIKSLRSKFIVSYAEAVGADGILRYNLNQLRADDKGTISGRFSSTDKNIQQVQTAKKQIAALGDRWVIRQLFVPADPKHLFFASDAMQIEYRLFAHYAASPKILAAYAENPKLSYHELVWDVLRKFKPDMPYRRAKDINFAKVYGAGKDKIAKMMEISRKEADEFIEIYDRMFPEVKPLIKRASAIAEQRGYVKSIMGRRTRFRKVLQYRDTSPSMGEVTEDFDPRFYKALNAVIQPSAADINKKKLVELHKARKKTGFIMRATVHDEVFGDVPDQESAKMVDDILNTQSFNLRVPIFWDSKAKANWAECK